MTMLEVIKSGSKINFVSKFKVCTILSSILVIGSIILVFKQMQYGVDFRGGAEIQAKFNQKLDLNDLRKTMGQAGFKGILVQTIGEVENHEFLLKVQAEASELNQMTSRVEQTLNDKYASIGVIIEKVDIVGPKAGAQLRFSGFLAMFWALLSIMFYIGLRFHVKYSPGAIVALFHDVSIVLGVYALTGTEFTLQTVAAILAVIGYSVNDTVIVYDRVREHESKFAGIELKNHINNAINETLSRTILTSGTTLFVSIMMLYMGGLAIRDFFLAMTVGIIVGTYSSIFVAAPITLFFEKFVKSK